MKSFWTLCLVAVMAAMGFSSYAQAREDRKNIVFDRKSGMLTQATGWKVNEQTGKWVSHQNFISDLSASSTDDPFYWIQMASFVYKGQPYYVLYYKFRSGSYKYPAIHQDWIPRSDVIYYLMTPQQYAILYRAMDKADGSTASIPVWEKQYMYAEDSKLTGEITNELDQHDGFNAKLYLSVQSVKGVKVVRFNWNVFSFGSETPLKSEYYETDFNSFKKLILPMTALELHQVDSLNAIPPPLTADEIKQKAYEERRKAESEEYQRAIAQAEKERLADEAKAQAAAKLATEKAAAITSWTNSGILLVENCNWQHDKNKSTVSFDWASVISFDFKGQRKYCFSYHYDKYATGGKEKFLLVLNPDQYAQIKEAVNAKEGKDLKVASKVNTISYAGYDEKKLLTDVLYDPTYSSYESCLEVNVKKGKVKFRLPNETCMSNSGLNTPDAWGYFESDTKEFAKLFTLP